MGDLGEITGAYVDAQTNSLVLLGRSPSGAPSKRSVLPGLDLDHFAVALRATLAGQELGVSIDPPAEYRDGMKSGQVPPDNTPMLVSYLGNTRGTMFGAIMFEADRLLKSLNSGVDNETREARQASVPGFKSLLEMISPDGDSSRSLWHRFWFVIDRVQLKHDPATNALAFSDVRLKVLTETEKEGAPVQQVHPLDARFAGHLTDHYDEYAREFPVLARLKDIAKLAALARYLCNLGTSVDLGALFANPPVGVDTPETTPGVSVRSPNVAVRQEGSVTHTHTVSLFGGVALEVEPTVTPDDGAARRLQTAARAACPGPGVKNWSFRCDGKASGAVRIRLAAGVKGLRKVSCDLPASAPNRQLDLEVQRVYDPRLVGEFGPGWSLFLPFRLTVIEHSGKREEVLTKRERGRRSGQTESKVLLLHNLSTGECAQYRLVHRPGVAEGTVFGRVTKFQTRPGGVSFEYDPSKTISRVKTEWRLAEDGRCYWFEQGGHLSRIEAKDGSMLRYEYRNDRLVRVANNRSRSFNIEYDTGNRGRITRISGSDGRSLTYRYDWRGCLASVADQSGVVETYRYDERRRLAEVRDRNDRVDRYAYDDLSNPVVGATDVLDDGFGGQLRRTFDQQQRLVSVTDATGTRVHYEYGTRGELLAARISDVRGRTWQIEYNARGLLRRLRESTGYTVSFYYDEPGRLMRVVNNRGQCWELKRDSGGRVTRLENQEGDKWDACFDDQHRLTELVSPESERWQFSYRDGILRRLKGSRSEVSISPAKETVALRTNLPGGWWREATYPRKRHARPTGFQCADAPRLRYQYDEDGQLRKVFADNLETVRFEPDPERLTLRVSFK